MRVFACVCVHLSVCPLDYWKSYERVSMEFFGGVGHGSGEQSVRF